MASSDGVCEQAPEYFPEHTNTQETAKVQNKQPSSGKQEIPTPITDERPTGEDSVKPKGDTAPTEREAALPERQQEEGEEEDDEEPEDGVPIALVTGASGHIAMHIVKQLLEQGHFRVRGTVRDKKREDEVKPLKDLVPDAKYSLRLVSADLEKPESWVKAVKRCSYVLHVASPVPRKEPMDEEEVICTAINGVTNVLKACVEAGTVKRVVLTSSTAAICESGASPPNFINEKNWPIEANCTPYEKGKLKAEQTAWHFVRELEADKTFELVVMNPGYVQGPFLSKPTGRASGILLAEVLNGASPTNVSFGIVDVRDVAAAHIAGMEKPFTAGKRHILVGDTVNLVEVSQFIASEFKPQGYNVSVIPVSKVVLFFVKFFNERAKSAYSLHGKQILWWNGRMKNVLEIVPRPVEDTLLDTCYSLIDLGVVKKSHRYLGHPSTRPGPEPWPEAAAPKTTAEVPLKEEMEESRPEDTMTTEEPAPFNQLTGEEEDPPTTE